MSEDQPAPAVLLDTCAVIWLANGDPLLDPALSAIVYAELADGVFVSPVSAWEIGMLSKPRSGKAGAPHFRPDPKTWFARLMAFPAIKPAAMTLEIAIDASYLPGDFHADPGDRLIVATARHLGAPIVTRDRRIIAYAKAGFVKVIVC